MNLCPEPTIWIELDALAGDARTALLAHAHACSACRKRLLAEDPTRAFALLALRPVPQAALARVSASVMAAVDAAHEAPLPATRRAVVAGWAAAAILAIAVAGMLASPLRAPRMEDDPADIALGVSPLGPARAGVEVLSSPGASRVVDLAVGETQVVMIFDERLDL